MRGKDLGSGLFYMSLLLACMLLTETMALPRHELSSAAQKEAELGRRHSKLEHGHEDTPTMEIEVSDFAKSPDTWDTKGAPGMKELDENMMVGPRVAS